MMSNSSDSFAREVHQRRTALVNEIVTLTRIETGYTARGNSSRWDAWGTMNGQQVRVILWAEHRHLITAAGYTVDWSSPNDQPVCIPVLLDKSASGWIPASVYGADNSEYTRLHGTKLAQGMTLLRFQNGAWKPQRIEKVTRNSKGLWMDLAVKVGTPPAHRIEDMTYIVKLADESEVVEV